MRRTSLVTISLPPKMLKVSERMAQEQNMTRSELVRIALRRYMEQTGRQISKKNILKLAKEDTRLWKKIEKDFRQIRSELMRERYPYLYE